MFANEESCVFVPVEAANKVEVFVSFYFVQMLFPFVLGKYICSI
jgi:hypothetical protein